MTITRRTGLAIAATMGLLLSAAAMSMQQASWPARAIPAHEVPVPTLVSPQMQAMIAQLKPSDLPMSSPPTTNAGYIARTNPDPAAKRREVEAMLARFALTLREETIAGVHCYVLTPRVLRSENRRRMLVHYHGGAYTAGAGEAGLAEALLVAGTSGIPTVSVDYRMPPDHAYPAPVDDGIAVWREISRRRPAARLGMFGTSAGGGLALSVVQRALAEKLPAPAAVFLGTPWSDLSETGDSYFTNRYLDPMVYQGNLSVSARQYAGALDLKDPRISPVYGSFSSFPPTLLVSGTRDLFLSNTLRVDRKLRDAGRDSQLIVYEGLRHAQYLAGPDYPETRTAMADIAHFFDTHLAR